jgi:hypothetical protein
MKGGILKGLAQFGSYTGSKLLKKTEKAFVADNARGRLFSLSNPETFMGKKLKVHAFSLQKVAQKVFDFAKKYEKYGRVCKKEQSQCFTREQVKKDKEELIRQIEEYLPKFDHQFYIKDPRKGNYKTINNRKTLRKEDILFLFRLKLLLEKWGVKSILDEQYAFIKGPMISDGYWEGVPIYFVKKGENKIITSFDFNDLTQKDETDKFNERYNAQYKMVEDNARDGEAEASESATSSEVQKYVDGIKDKQEYKGTKYTLKRLDKGFSIETNE